MIMILFTLLFSLALDALAIGSLAFMLFGEKLAATNYRKGLLALFIFFALTHLLLVPGFLELHLSFMIGNETIAKRFHIEGKLISLKDSDWVTWYDVGYWFVQSVVAYFSGHFLYDGLLRRGLTNRSS